MKTRELPIVLASPMVNEREAALLLGVAARTLRRWRRERPPRLRFVTLGPRVFRYYRADVEGFLSRRTVEAAA